MTTPLQFIQVLRAQLGVPYKWGGKTPSEGLDCSGLIHYALAECGVPFVHGSANQIAACTPVSLEEAARTPGALLWREGHDAISLGGGRTIEAVIKPRNGVGEYPNNPQRFTSAGLIPGINYQGEPMPTMINPVVGWVSSEWSKDRVNPATGRRTSHAGIDIAAPIGTPVEAAFGGTVVSIRTGSYNGDPGLWRGLKSGNHVRIKNSDGAIQYYGHLSVVGVKVGQKIKQGQVIGKVGNTGQVTGPHLHFECWSSDNVNTNFNPRILFNRYGIKPGVDPIPSKLAGSITAPAASKPATPTPEIPKDWFDMATESDIRNIVRDEVRSALADVPAQSFAAFRANDKDPKQINIAEGARTTQRVEKISRETRALVQEIAKRDGLTADEIATVVHDAVAESVVTVDVNVAGKGA